jgi:hypothetical protein
VGHGLAVHCGDDGRGGADVRDLAILKTRHFGVDAALHWLWGIDAPTG